MFYILYTYFGKESLGLYNSERQRNNFDLIYKNPCIGGASGWLSQLSVRLQVVISWFMSLSSVSDSVLTAQSLEPASGSVFPSLSAPLPLSENKTMWYKGYIYLAAYPHTITAEYKYNYLGEKVDYFILLCLYVSFYFVLYI